MSIIKTVTVGELEENCYLVQVNPGGRLFIIDPGAEPERILSAVNVFDAPEKVILFTHGHFDHIGAAGELVRKLGIKDCYLNSRDRELFYSRDNAWPPYIPPAENLPEVNGTINYPEFETIFTPGHTPGGVSFYFKQIPALFSGDTLFAGSVGRTDFPGGNTGDLLKSIQEKLMILPDDTPVYPGHGPATSIGREKEVNPYY